jgi:internalin A
MRALAILFVVACSTPPPARPTTPPAPTAPDPIALVTQLGGTVTREITRDGDRIVKVDLHETQVTDAQLAVIATLTDLRELDLRKTPLITDAGVVHLRGLVKLEKLNLFRTQLSDVGIAYLADMHVLDTLLIGGTRITERGVEQLSKLRKLRKLSLFDTQIGDSAVQFLSVFPSLEVVLIGRSKISEDGVRAIQAAKPAIKFTEQT